MRIQNSFNSIPKIAALSLLVLLCTSNAAWAKAHGIGFIIGDKGETRKVILHTRNVFTLGKGFPFIEKPVAIGITDNSSAGESVRIELDPRICDWISCDAYPLDSDRLVLNGHDHLSRNYFVAVWDWRENQLRTYNNVGSRSSESISGISPDEKWAVSVPSDRSEGLIFHDLQQGTSSRLFNGLNVYSPRFSPDGTQWAFFSRDELILRSTRGGKEKRVPISPVKGRWRYSKHLAWSPSGRYLAGIVDHDRADLVIWKSDGAQMKIVALPPAHSLGWPPIWGADEKGVYVVLGNEGLVGKWEPLQIKLISIK
jgi:hypothetical protein